MVTLRRWAETMSGVNKVNTLEVVGVIPLPDAFLVSSKRARFWHEAMRSERLGRFCTWWKM